MYDNAYTDCLNDNCTVYQNDTYMCCLHETPRTFDWCEDNCGRYYGCDTVAWALDEVDEDGEEG